MDVPGGIALDTQLRRMRALRRRLSCSDAELLETYWRCHPRFRFVKTAAANARLLDIGAGSGGLAHWKGWLEPKRDDIVFHGVDRHRGVEAHLYRAWESVDLDHAAPSFHGVAFDAFVLSHVIEHVRDPARMVDWIASRAAPGGRVYLEWPGENAARQPGREDFARHGIDIVITNFFDDSTHLRVISSAELEALLTGAGFAIAESGTIDHGMIGEEMLARGLANGDGFARMAGYWSISGWSRWIVATLPTDRQAV